MFVILFRFLYLPQITTLSTVDTDHCKEVCLDSYVFCGQV